MKLRKIRYVVHPDDEIELALDVGSEFEELFVTFDLDASKPFITQVHDRMTIADHAVRLKDEFVKHPFEDMEDGEQV